MQVQVEQQDAFIKKLSVTVESDRVSGAIDAAFKRVAQKARIPGFRKGKAPRHVLQMHYGSQIDFEVINQAHTCNGDSDCTASEWPGCERPVSKRHKAMIDGKQKSFKEGNCSDEPKNCRKAPEVYCKQGLCVFREQPGQTNPVK